MARIDVIAACKVVKTKSGKTVYMLTDETDSVCIWLKPMEAAAFLGCSIKDLKERSEIE